MSARIDALARRKEDLRLRSRLERLELQGHVLELRRLRKPANFVAIGARIFGAWRSPAWLASAAALLVARGGNARLLRALRYAGYAWALWRSWQLVREYAAERPRRDP